MLEEKLLQGGEVISKASKQEGLLRKAEQELRERQQQESRLARELAEKEEANLQLEGAVRTSPPHMHWNEHTTCNSHNYVS
jgi:hypothetical protein